MPRNGSGGYTLPGGINPVVTQTLITSNWANTTLDDVAVALTNSLAKDGQTLPTANLPMGGFAHTGAGDPASRDMYDTLGYVQDGRHFRLTNVAGVNQITATLPGGAVTLSVGQIIQLLPVSSNTGPVTLNINGIGARPVTTDLGNPLATGNLVANRPYLLSYTGTSWVMITAGGGSSGIAQAAMSGWDRPTANGPYPPITAVDATTVAIPAGTGRIIKPSARDLSGVTEVSWAAQNVVLSFVATSWNTILGINALGQVVQFTGNFSPVWARENILIGSVAHINGVINEINTVPAIFGDMTYASYDVSSLLHNTLISGGRLLANAVSPFHVDLQAGAIFTLGGDANDVNDPNKRDFPSSFDLSFFPVTGNNTVSAITQNVPVTNYDPNGAGAIVAIPGGASTTSIHRMYLLAGEFIFLYGQKTYADLTTALSQLGVDDSATIFPSKLTNATFLSYIVAQKDCADLKDTTKARLLTRGGTSFSIGSASSISEAPINGLIYGRKDAGWSETIPAPKGPSSTLRQIFFDTNLLHRWSITVNDTPEGGGNTGSSLEIRRYDDAGVLINSPVAINRTTGEVFTTASLTVQGAASHITAGGDVRANSNFASTNTSVVLATSAAGNIFLRPNGAGSSSGQTTIASNGNLIAAGGVSGIGLFARPQGGGEGGELTLEGTGGASNAIIDNVGPQTRFFGGAAAPMQWNRETGELTAPGSITSGQGVIANQNFGSSSNIAVLGPAAAVAGTVLLRPNGVNVSTNEFTFASNGNFGAAGSISGFSVVSQQDFTATGVNCVLAAQGGGIFLRPNGAGSAVGQAILGAAGNFSCADVSTSNNVAATGRVTSGTHFNGLGVTTVLSANGGGGGSILFRPQGADNGTNQATLDAGGNFTSVNQTATSDQILKENISPKAPRRNLADLIALYTYVWKSDGRAGMGQIAQQVREHAPEYVHEGTDGILSIDKASLAMECILGLAERVKELEDKVNDLAG